MEHESSGKPKDVIHIANRTWAAVGTAIIFAASAGHGYFKAYRAEAATTVARPAENISDFWVEAVFFAVTEIGIAIIIACVVIKIFDEEKRRQEEQRAERQRAEAKIHEEQLVQNVFRGVLGIEHSPDYVTAVIDSNLRQNIIRGRLSLVYVISEIPNGAGLVWSDGLVQLDQSITYELFNKSQDEAEVDVKFGMEVPFVGEPYAHSFVYEATIEGREFPVQTVEGNRAQLATLDPVKVESSDSGVNCFYKPTSETNGISKQYRWKRIIPARSSIKVLIKAKVVRRSFDTDTFSSLYPSAEGMSLHVVAPIGFKMWIKNRTPTKTFPQVDFVEDGIGEWHINGPILANNSVELWWKEVSLRDVEVRQ